MHFIPAHPIAGTNIPDRKPAFRNSFGRWCILSLPRAPTRPPSGNRGVWRRAGSDIEIMNADHHDRVPPSLHLPHLIAFTIVGTATDRKITCAGKW